MKVTFDLDKRARTLVERGLDMADAAKVFEGAQITTRDDRRDYGEERHLTIGYLEGRMVALVWTQRGESLRVISMRKTNVREQDAYQSWLCRE